MTSSINYTDLNLDFDSIPKKDLSAYNLSEADRKQVLATASTIKLGDANSAVQFGGSGNATNRYLDDMLSEIRVYEQTESGKQLAEVAEMAQQVSDSIQPTRFQLMLRRVPVVGPLVARLAVMQRKTMRRFDSVAGQVDVLTVSMNSMSNGYLEMNTRLEGMYGEVLSEIKQQSIQIVAAQVAINSLNAELAKLQAQYREEKDNLLLGAKISDVEYQINALKNRRANMISNKEKATDDLTILRMMQQNNLTMIDKFRSLDEMTIPATKRGHIIINALEKQNNGAKLQKALDDTTNMLAVRQASLVKESSVLIAKQSHRTVYDVETLNTVSRIINETVLEVKKIHNQSSDGYMKLEKRALEIQEERRETLLLAMEKN